MINHILPIFLAATSPGCPEVEFRNKTSIWSERDKEVYEQSHKRCMENVNNQCLKYFIKSEEQVYVVYCGIKDLDK
jgi:hypothetical protein